MTNLNPTLTARNLILAFAVSVGLLGSCVQLARAQGPENTVLVVNAKSPDSLAIANHYVHLRNIPPSHVIYLDKITLLPSIDAESAHSKYFQSEIIKPISEAISARGLEDQIDCVVYSAGFPTRISFQTQLNNYLKHTGKKYSIRLHAPWASINSLTYFQENVFSTKPMFVDLDANRYARPQTRSLLSNPFDGDTSREFDQAHQQLKNGNSAAATAAFSKLNDDHPNQVVVRYLFAKSLVMNGDLEEAIGQLAICRNRGWCYRSVLSKDNDFRPIRQDPKFQQVLDGMLDLPLGMLPSRSFSARSNWSKNGWPNNNERDKERGKRPDDSDQGQRFMLSTVLAVTGENQSTLTQALAQIESSVESDGTHPVGTFFFSKHSDIRSKIRHAQIDFAAKELKSMGMDVVVSDQPWPKNNKRLAGATLGNAVIKWNDSGSRFLPGALCDNLTSFGGWWVKAAQTQLTDHLHAGAAGATGTVYEPWTITPKFPDARLHVHYARGCSLAESFYQSIGSPFQLLIVGDPLCRPYGNFPRFKVTGIESNARISGDLDLNIIADATGPAVAHYEIFFDGQYLLEVNRARKIRIATDEMADGYHEVRVVAVADSLVAVKKSQSLGFVLNRNGKSAQLTAKKAKIKLGQNLVLAASSTGSQKLDIVQNYRIVGSIKPGESTSIDSRLLGLGKSKLRALSTINGTTIASSPLEIEIVKGNR